MHSFYYKFFDYIDSSQPSHIGIYFSLFLHLSILLFAIGLPDFFKPKKILIPQVIPIEILNISDVTSLVSKKADIEINDTQNKIIKQKKFSSSETTEIQKLKIQEKPKKKININNNLSEISESNEKSNLKKILLKEKNNNLKEQQRIKIDNPETLKVNKIRPKIKPKVSENIDIKSDVRLKNKTIPITQKEVENKIIDEPKPTQKPEPDFNLATMLKDLRNEDTISQNDDIVDKEKLIQDEKNNVQTNLEVSISEMDLVLQQLRSCFNPRAGTQIVGDEMVKISAKIDKQAFVRKDTVQIIDTNISNSNPYYEAITESAVATLYNPLCSKLKLPLNKYDSWKDLKITIDYSWIKN